VRLQEEMGITTALSKAFDFIYKAPFDNGLTEYEFDHVFIGNHDGQPAINPEEVAAYCYKSMEEVRNSLNTHPEQYTVWFKIAFPKIADYLNKVATAV